jgi:hypothetical protein
MTAIVQHDHLGSARVSRAGEGLWRSRTFILIWQDQSSKEQRGERLFRRDAGTSTQVACATQI